MFAVIANQPGRHGFDVVGPFETRDAASGWLSGNAAIEGFVKPLTAPDQWEPNDGSRDDEPLT